MAGGAGLGILRGPPLAIGAGLFVGEGLLALEGRAGLGLPGAAEVPFVTPLGGLDLIGESRGGSDGGSEELSSIFFTSLSAPGETDLTVLTLALEDKESLLEVRLIL